MMTGAIARGVACATALVSGIIILAPPSALATVRPHFIGTLLSEEVHATRVAIEPREEASQPVTGRAEYAPAEAGHEPPPNSPSWKVANTISTQVGQNELHIGSKAGTAGNDLAWLRHLSPATAYYARFSVSNSEGEATEVVPFETLPVGKPEIARRKAVITEGSSLETTFRPFGPSTSKAEGFLAQLETNGAEITAYSFAYSTSKAGPWTVCATGSVTLAEEFADPEALCSGLTPETTYFARLSATNEKGTTEEILSFTTPTAKPVVSEPTVRNVTSSSAHLGTIVSPHGSETHWRWETAASLIGPWTPVPGAVGTISQAQAEALPFATGVIVGAKLTGLSPSTSYYVRLFAESAAGEGINGFGEPISTETRQIASFETAGPPAVRTFATHGLHGESIRLLGAVDPASLPTTEEQTITLEGAPTGGTFTLAFNGQSTGGTSTGTTTSGSSTVAAIPLAPVKGTGNVLHPSTCGTPAGTASECSKVTGVTASVGRFRPGQAISGRGIAPGTHIHSVEGGTLVLDGESVEAVSGAELTSGSLSPFVVGESIGGTGIPAGTNIADVRYAADFTATLTLSANATVSAGNVAIKADLPYNADAPTVQRALEGLESEPGLFVEGSAGGPYTVWFQREGNQPQIEANASGLEPSGTITVATTQQGGESSDTHYHFEYVSQRQFEEGGFAKAVSTSPVDLGSGVAFTAVGVDLPGLTPGETYRYRVSATNTSAVPNPVVDGEEQTLTVPAAAVPGVAEPCPNEAFRSGPSASLPDCRAYEQLTPIDKEGAQEPFHYAESGIETSALAGEDGEHFMVNASATKWGAPPGGGQSPYFFSREAGKGWGMTAAGSQPEFGLNNLFPEVFDPRLTRFGFNSNFNTTGVASKDLQFMAGPPGGPYTSVATVPRNHVNGSAAGWVAASSDFSKLILEVEDRKLLEVPTSTKSGYDLYEYSGGALRQVNVGIGTCGATVAHGREQGALHAIASSSNSVSADGRRVFFEAIPGSNCSEPSHLYVRVDGAETLDLGAVRFLAANETATKVLVEKTVGESHEALLYDAEATSTAHLFTLPGNHRLQDAELHVSAGADLNAVYFASSAALTPEAPSGGGLYRYDIAARSLQFIIPGSQGDSNVPLIESVSQDGRYAYFGAGELAGVPGGGVVKEGREVGHRANQIYRYDSVANVVECVSCASSFNPEPRQPAFLSTREAVPRYRGALPGYAAVSANGDFAFFSTPAALVPQDVDGEIAIPADANVEGVSELASDDTSPSSDVYEWRRSGVDGCVPVQGCLALITNGRGGHLNLLLGTAHEGRDVFIWSRSQLLTQDQDTAGDVYDVRIGGGFPEAPPRPTECEGDACSTPPPAPNDATPSSFTFTGAGNLVSALAPPPPASHPLKCRKGLRLVRKRCVRVKAKKHAKQRSHRASSSHRRGRP
jgi:hypothetical protein